MNAKSAFRSHTVHAAAATTTASPTAAPSPTTTIRTPRSLEMRLAMNNDILGDEDLMSYAPAPDLTSILGRDLSTYHRMSGRDIIMNQIITRTDGSSPSSRSSNPSDRADQPNSSCQQNNSKMDTPILNRRLPRTWSSSGFVRKGEKSLTEKARNKKAHESFFRLFTEEKALSDLERLARREKIYCMKLQNQNSDSDSSSKTIVPSKKNKL